LGNYTTPNARDALAARLAVERDAGVREEILHAFGKDR
jgi:hypothetical protein